MNDEMRLVLEQLLKTLERLGERNERLSANLDRAERIREADAVRTNRGLSSSREQYQQPHLSAC